MAKQMSPKEMERANNKVEQSALSKLKKENAELKRQIAFLTGICRRCYSGGSISSSQFDTYSMSKDTICEYCDITQCKYSGKHKESLSKNENGTYQHQNIYLQQQQMQQQYIGYNNFFPPQQR